MMHVEPSNLEALTRTQCESAGLDPDSIRSIWLFGSRTTPDADANADWDVLAVAPGLDGMRRFRAGALDVVVVSPEPQAAWLRCDLGVHVARYGQILFGHDEWRAKVDVEQALYSKRERTAGRLQHLGRAWPQLSPRFQLKHGRKLRRDAQMVLSLSREQTVPPRPHLDAGWASMNLTARRRALCEANVVDGLEHSFIEALAGC